MLLPLRLNLVPAEPVGGYEVEEANFYEILEPKKAKKKIRIIRKVIRKKRVEQKAKPKQFDSSKLQALQEQYKILTNLYEQVQKSAIKRESVQATKSKVEAQKQAEKLQLQYLEQQEVEDEEAMIEILLQFL